MKYIQLLTVWNTSLLNDAYNHFKNYACIPNLDLSVIFTYLLNNNLLSEDEIKDLQDRITSNLDENGLDHYEINSLLNVYARFHLTVEQLNKQRLIAKEIDIILNFFDLNHYLTTKETEKISTMIVEHCKKYNHFILAMILKESKRKTAVEF